MTTNRRFTTFTLLAFACSFAAQVQQTYAPFLFEALMTTEAVELSPMRVDARVTLSNEYIQRLASSYEQTKEEALQYIIYLATYHPEALNARRATMPLHDIYRLDRDEQLRIMARAGLRMIGSETIMRHLSRDVQLERSDKVRRLTKHALIDYSDLGKNQP